MRVRWAGRRPRLWRSVIRELQVAEELTRGQRRPDADHVRQLRRPRRDRRRRRGRSPARSPPAGSTPTRSTRRPSPATSTCPSSPTPTCSCARSGEQRHSNFLLWQSAYAELVFLDTLWPDFDRRHLWEAIEIYARRDRRFGGATEARLSGPSIITDRPDAS